MVYVATPMKTSLDHLPPAKRDPIAAIAALLQAGAPVEILILFGSYARGDWVDDPLTKYVSDFDVRSVSHKWQCQGLGTGMRKEGKKHP